MLYSIRQVSRGKIKIRQGHVEKKIVKFLIDYNIVINIQYRYKKYKIWQKMN